MTVSINEATNAEIMWAFFGTTKEYPLIIGSIQIIGAVLLVFQRTKIIGAILLTPVFINIILLDILYQIDHRALLNAVLFQMVFFFVMIRQRKQIRIAINLLTSITKTESTYISLIKFSVGIFLAFLLFVIHQMVT